MGLAPAAKDSSRVRGTENPRYIRAPSAASKPIPVSARKERRVTPGQFMMVTRKRSTPTVPWAA